MASRRQPKMLTTLISFLNWNIPYGALGSLQSGSDHPSPFGPSVSTPSDISIMATPPANLVSSPRDAPSPLSTALKRKTAIERAQLFVQGKHDDLIRSMDKAERRYDRLYLCMLLTVVDKSRRITSTWLYQFWIFSFRTAKYWGRGPRDWTADNLGFTTPQGPTSIPSPHTPGMIAPSPDVAMDSNPAGGMLKPSPLCRWSIHVQHQDYMRIPSPDPESPNPQEDANWAKWPESWEIPSFEERLRNGLESNDFSNIKTDQLPLAVPQIARAAKRSPNELLEESLGFAIMAGNENLVEDLAIKVKVADAVVDISELYPYHLATSYLHGSKSCCNILDRLCTVLPFKFRIRELYVNRLGHTVLDNLMIAILKAHTSTLPGNVDDALKRENRFAGEEVDICGRWDADSDCFRALLASGRSSVPFEWKHKFCHTSVQSICHCIEVIGFHGGYLDVPSGLFLRYCSHCGRKLQLLPLHTLVLTAFQLAQFGCEGEDLFGIVACLLCLLHILNGAHDPAEISVEMLLGEEQSSYCCHEEVTPLELAEKVPTSIRDKWPRKVKTGWRIFCHILRNAQENDEGQDSDWEDDGDVVEAYESFDGRCDWHCNDSDIMNTLWGSTYLGHIWAAIQTEMLTYRRLEEYDPWTSENFDMDDLLKSLEAGVRPSVGYIEKQMMRPYCNCGRFQGTLGMALREEAAASYFSNLDDWNRTTFTEVPFVN
jgi:hypothetical protein